MAVISLSPIRSCTIKFSTIKSSSFTATWSRARAAARGVLRPAAPWRVVWEAMGRTKVPIWRERALGRAELRRPSGGCRDARRRCRAQPWREVSCPACAWRETSPAAAARDGAQDNFFGWPRRGGARRPTPGRNGIARGYGYLTLTGCDAATTARITLRGPDSVDAHKGPCYPKSSRRSRQAAARSGSVCRAETGRRSRRACFDGGLPPRQASGSAPG